MRTHESCAKVIDGSIYTCNGNILEHPALAIDQETGTLISWGDLEMVERKYEKTLAAYATAGLPAGKLCIVAMDDAKFTREEQCYVIRRCVEYTASGFQTELCRQAASGTDPKAWLAAELARGPIDVTC